jgi:hypothetical protein
MRHYVDLRIEILDEFRTVRVEREAPEDDLGAQLDDDIAFDNWINDNLHLIKRAALGKLLETAADIPGEDHTIVLRGGDLSKF